MADTAAFEDFVTTRSTYLLRTAYALTRDHTNAEDLLQTALARSWPAWGRIANDPEPTPGGFPEYTKGYHIIASEQVPFARTGTSFTWTPSTYDVAIFTMCTHEARDVMVSVKAVINDRIVSDYGCLDGRPMTPEISAPAVETALRPAGVVLGQPVNITIVVDEPVKISGLDLDWEPEGSIPAEGRAAIGIGEQMSFSNYPLPRRPRQLIGLEPYSSAGITASINSNGSVFPLHRGQRYVVKARSQTQA